MLNAYRQNNLKLMGAVAHKIKPSLDNLKIEKLKEDIRIIEKAGKENASPPDLSELLSKTREILTLVVQKMKHDFL